MNRRKAIAALSTAGLGFAGIGFFGCESFSKKPAAERDPLYPYVLPYSIWTEESLEAFLAHCDQTRMSLIALSLELGDKPVSIYAAENQIIWLSTNIWMFPFTHSVEYHKIVQWLAGKYGVDSSEIQTASTFTIEHQIMKKVFVQVWDNLTPEQRTQVLSKIDSVDSLNKKGGIALLGGSAALATLSTSMAMTGFAFYTTMSSVICETAVLFGVTLPFGAYTSASVAAATLGGPVGWAIGGITAVGGVAFVGSANQAKCAAFIVQMHMIKVDALNKAGMLTPVLQNLQLA
jgi:uncharacterized protein YaaW (UPF0174 family)